MQLSLLNPTGLWLLAGCVAVVGIHLIQQRFKQQSVSTLFLLGEVEESTSKAKRLDWLRNSWLFWLQLLLAALVALLYSQPYLSGLASKSKIVLVLDGSYSMLASKRRVVAEIGDALEQLPGGTKGSELLLFDTAVSGALYQGDSLPRMKEVLEGWKPSHARVDVLKTLRQTGDLHPGADQLVFLSDHQQEVPENWNLVSFGREIENWGMSGFSIEESTSRPGFHSFDGIVKNFGNQVGEKNWWLEVDGQRTNMGRIKLEPGQLANLRADIASSSKKIIVGTDEDEFVFDDILPFVVPKPQSLKVYLERGKFSSSLRKLISSLPNISRVNRAADADFVIRTFQEGSSISSSDTISLYSSSGKAGKPQSLVPEENQLTNHLSFSGLWVSKIAPYQATVNDRVLIWADSIPAVFLRGVEVQNEPSVFHEQLVVNFDLRYSNALSSPAFILLLGRYIEQRRSDSTSDLVGNFDLGASLRPLLKSTAGGSEMTLASLASNSQLQFRNRYKVPAEPSFFSFKKEGHFSIDGASQLPTMEESSFVGFGPFVKRARKLEVVAKESGAVKEIGTAGLLFVLLVALLTWFLSENGSKRLHSSGSGSVDFRASSGRG